MDKEDINCLIVAMLTNALFTAQMRFFKEVNKKLTPDDVKRIREQVINEYQTLKDLLAK